MLLTVHREALNPNCFGTMTLDGNPFGFTLERPWLENHNGVSAIPPGTYKVAITPSKRFGRDMLEILHVPGRAGIRIHNANFPSELEGCIAVAAHRASENHIYGGLAGELQSRIKTALDNGVAVQILILDPVQV